MNQEGVVAGIGAALSMAFAMGWEILCALALGFVLSGVVQAVGGQHSAEAVRRG